MKKIFEDYVLIENSIEHGILLIFKFSGSKSKDWNPCHYFIPILTVCYSHCTVFA